MRPVLAVLPGDVAAVPTGGNLYDLRLCTELAALGRPVRQVRVPGGWPDPAAADRDRLARVLAAEPDGALVLIDGLVGCGVPEIVVPHTRRLRIVVLVHLPLADETGLGPDRARLLAAAERAVLDAAAAVVVTGRWAAARIGTAAAAAVAEPGTDPAPVATGTDGASRLLCLAALVPRKSQDVLISALARVTDLSWTCTLAGPTDRDPVFTERVRSLVARHRLGDRITMPGPLGPADRDAALDATDLAVLVSHAETFGMAAAEALARGVPVLAADAGALPDTLGTVTVGPGRADVPGLLVPPGDPDALAGAVRRWLTDAGLRDGLRVTALARRGTLGGWAATARTVNRVLENRVPGRAPPTTGTTG